MTGIELIGLARISDREHQNTHERLNSENTRLSTQNDILLERFARWQHNLQKMDGVDLNKLAVNIDNGLPAKNRD